MRLIPSHLILIFLSTSAFAANLARDSAYGVTLSGFVYRGQVIPGTNTPATAEGYLDAPPWQGAPHVLTDGRRDGEAVVSWYWSAMSKRLRVEFDLRRECRVSTLRLLPPDSGNWSYDGATVRFAPSLEALQKAPSFMLQPEGESLYWTGEAIRARYLEVIASSSAPQVGLAEVEIEGEVVGDIAVDAPPVGLITATPRDLGPLTALPARQPGYTNIAPRPETRVTLTSAHYDDQAGGMVADDRALSSDPTGRLLVDGNPATSVRSFTDWYAAKQITVDLDLGGSYDLDRVVVWSAGHGAARSFVNAFTIWVQAGIGAAWYPLGDTWNPLRPDEFPAAQYPIISPMIGRAATAIRLQLNGVMQSADYMEVGEIEVWGQPTAQPLAARPWRVIKLIPPIMPVASGELSSAMDWITRERLRALYGYVGQWRDTDLLDRVVGAGFNCFLVHTMGATHSEHGWPEEAQHWAEVQQQRGLHIIISWPYGSDERYGNTQFGAYQPGGPNVWLKTPCPLSREYWDKVVGDRACIAAQAGLAGLVVDMEMYGADSTRHPGPCYCDTCWEQFVLEYLEGVTAKEIPLAVRPAWTAANNVAEDYTRWQELQVMDILRSIENRIHAVAPNFILGNLLDIESLPGLARGFGTPELPALIFGEREYGGDVSVIPQKVAKLRADGYPALYVTGLAVKLVTPPQLPDLVATCGPVSAGYWLWSSAAFRAEVSSDYQHAAGYSHDDYWQAFRVANNGLTQVLNTP